MKITDAEASRLTRFLTKGIFENPANKDVDISIGDNAQIGIMRRGHKYYLYIRYNNTIDKQDMLSGFNENVAIDLLSKNLKALIERSLTLKDVSLNMEKVPMLAQEEETDAAKSTDIVFTETIPDEIVTETVPEPIPLAEQSSTEEDAMVLFEETEPDKDNNTKKIEDDSQEILFDESDSYKKNEAELEELIMMGTTSSTTPTETTQLEPTQIETSTGVKGLMPAKVNNEKLPEMSYLANVIGNNAEMKEKLIKAIDQLVLRDKESAVEFYIRILYRLLPLFGNDISSASTETNLDERDFMLSVYERQFFNK